MLGAKTLYAAIPALAGGIALAQPAQASMGFASLPMAIAASAFADTDACPATIAPAEGLTTVPIGPVQSKAAALLGGQVSQLELIRQQQAAALTQSAAALATSGTLAPAAAPSFAPMLRPANCSAGFVTPIRPVVAAPQLSAAVLRSAPVIAVSPDDFLASKRLAIRHTSFDKDWKRVSHASLSGSVAATLVATSRGAPDMATLAAVNSWTNAKVRYVEDRELYGRRDYWATAGETLRRGAGDCEDIAIAKMQLLAALGVHRDAMFLTIARDTVRAADHAVLVVKLDGKAWLLDNSTDRVLDASTSYDYRPIVSFSEDHRWVHGY